jgi:hypothetical protein
MNTAIFPVLVADVAQCMQQNVNQIAEDYYLDLYRWEVVAVHFFHHWLSSRQDNLLAPQPDGEWTKGLRAVSEMQQNPEQFARIPKVKASLRKAFMLELADQFPSVRANLLEQVQYLESQSLGYDFAALLKAVPDPAIREKIQGQIGAFFLQRASAWLNSLYSMAA